VFGFGEDTSHPQGGMYKWKVLSFREGIDIRRQREGGAVI
jgi:hypothetical protein